MSDAVETIAPDDRRLRLVGRWDRRDPARAITVNSGSHLWCRFESAGVQARFDVALNRPPLPTLAWRVDDGPWRESEIKPQLRLASELPPGRHTLLLLVRGLDEHQSRWKAPLTASVTLLGLSLTAGGRWLRPPPARKPKLEFFGDSITEGVLSHPERPGKTTWPWRSDGRCYPFHTAQALKAEWRQCGFGRQGLLIEGNGGVPKAAEAFNWFYAGALRDDWQPDLVCLNQGTNDGGKPAGVFAHAYRHFLGVVRAAYPHSIIAAMRPFNGAHETEVAAEVAARNAGGDSHVHYLDTSGWIERADTADGVHPTAAGHRKAARRLAPELRRLLKHRRG